MFKKKWKGKSQLIAEYQAEARRLAGSMTEFEERLIRVGLSKGRELEPAGRLAGSVGVEGNVPDKS